MDNRVERIAFETDRYLIVGDLTLPREGYRSRLSDFLNRGELDFIPLVNVELQTLGSHSVTPEKRQFAVVARSQIRLAYPFEPGGSP